MLLLLAGVFSLGGFVLVYVNSADMLRQAAAQAEQWHRMQYYTLETEVLGLMARASEVTDDALTERAMEIADFGDDGSQSGIWLGNADGMMLFSLAWRGGRRGQRGRAGHRRAGILPAPRAEGSTYLLFREHRLLGPEQSYRLRTLSDVTGVFAARDRQLARFWCMGWYPRRVRAGHCAADKAHDAPAG